MTKRPALVVFLFTPLWAQDPLALKDAVRLAFEKNRSIAAATAGEQAAASEIDEARSGFLPKLDYSESSARSNNPVFVFSTLLTQHQFTTQNFQIGPLNRADALNKAGEVRRRVRMEIVAGVVRSFSDTPG